MQRIAMTERWIRRVARAPLGPRPVQQQLGSSSRRGYAAIAALLLALACGADREGTPRPLPRELDDARLIAAASEDEGWLTHGRTYDEQRYSPLAQIDASNAADLGLVWSLARCSGNSILASRAATLVRSAVAS